MEELQTIETTSGRQFKPWVDADKLQQIVSDPASVTAIASEIASGKQAIASAINAKGGSASATESFSELAEAVEEIPNYSEYFKTLCVLVGTPAANAAEGVQQNASAGITKLIDTNGYISDIGGDRFKWWNLLTEVVLNGNIYITTNHGLGAFENCTALEKFIAPNSTVPTIGSIPQVFILRGCTSLKQVDLSKFQYISRYLFVSCNKLEKVKFGTLVRQEDNDSTLNRVIDLEIGQNTDINLTFVKYYPNTNIYLSRTADQWENHLTLYTNLKEHIIDRLYDHSEDGVNTRVLRIGFYATLYADSQLVDEPYGSYYTPLIKAMAQACITTCGQKLWTISA